MSLLKKIRQNIQQANEFYQMRKELMDHCNERFAQKCIDGIQDFYESLRTDLLNGKPFDQTITEKARRDSDRAYNATQLEIEQIAQMSDGEIKQMYYKTFGRWHPIDS